jgi:hypothetical protein
VCTPFSKTRPFEVGWFEVGRCGWSSGLDSSLNRTLCVGMVSFFPVGSGSPVGESLASLVAVGSAVCVGLGCSCTATGASAAGDALGPDVVDVSAFGEIDTMAEVEAVIWSDGSTASPAWQWECCLHSWSKLLADG